MVRKLFVWVIASTLGFGYFTVTFAAESSSGKQMYLQYCSSCHGKDGKGDGTVSRDLKVRVPDLTGLAKKNKGVYPLDDVVAAHRRVDGWHKVGNVVLTMDAGPGDQGEGTPA